MKQRDAVRRKLAAEWLVKADDDMTVAENLPTEGSAYTNAITFHCQQAAEKYLKALLTWHAVEFPKTHDLDQLLDLAQTIDKRLADSLRDVIVLTPYGVELRYPGDRPDATLEQAREAVRLAREVRTAVRGAVQMN